MRASPFFSFVPLRWGVLVGLCMVGGALADVTVVPGGDSSTRELSDKKRAKEMEERRQQLAAMIPEAKAAQVSFVAGRSVDVELEAATAGGGVRFYIREQPRGGTLSEIRPHPIERHKAVVTYTHTDEQQLTDRFSYACRVGEGAFSAAAVVSLRGRPAEPKLEVLRQPMFEKVLPGEETFGKAVIRNAGIGRFATTLVWPAPWKGPESIVVEVGETVEVGLLAEAATPGTVSKEIVLQEDRPESTLRLWLQCEQPFVVSPNRAQMEFDPETGERIVRAKVANMTRETMKLKVILPERLQGPNALEVRPGVLSEAIFRLEDEDVEAFAGDVLITDGVLSQRLTLGASAEPAQVRLLFPETKVLDFGSLALGTTEIRKVVIANKGGLASIVAIQAAPPFSVLEDESSLSVPPGATLELGIAVSSGKAGRFESAIGISEGERRIELKASAHVTDPAVPAMAGEGAARPVVGAARPAARPAAVAPVMEVGVATEDVPPAVEESREAVGPGGEGEGVEGESLLGRVDAMTAGVLTYLSTFGVPIPPDQLSRKLGRIESFVVTNRGTEHVDVVWESPPVDEMPQKYKVQQAYQRYNPVAKLFFRDWVDVEGVDPLSPGRGMTGVRLKGLRAASQYEVRFLGVDELGKVSLPSDILLVSTQAPFRLPGWVWSLGAIAALSGLVGCAYRFRLPPFAHA